MGRYGYVVSFFGVVGWGWEIDTVGIYIGTV